MFSEGCIEMFFRQWMMKQKIHLSGKFLFEQGFESTSSFLVFNKQFGPEPLVCRTSQSQPKVVVGHSCRPVVSPRGSLSLVMNYMAVMVSLAGSRKKFRILVCSYLNLDIDAVNDLVSRSVAASPADA